MNKNDFPSGEQLIEQGDHEQAFRHYQTIAGNSSHDFRTRADAYVWLGTLVRIAPGLGEGDECGLSFYQQAIGLDPENAGALLGIAETFGDYFPDHQDRAAFRGAMAWLLQHKDSLDEHVRKEVKRIQGKHGDSDK